MTKEQFDIALVVRQVINDLMRLGIDEKKAIEMARKMIVRK